MVDIITSRDDLKEKRVQEMIIYEIEKLTRLATDLDTIPIIIKIGACKAKKEDTYE